ncbi:MAG: type II 3-dehydroquinate dehydratase [Xanthomonadaceae bacterium]|nr:type II 3-dehydroquinate dehydratase [Xanthomonadaceae bacterium]
MAVRSAANGTETTVNVLVINGPNLNLLGSREPQIYGADTLAVLADRLAAAAQKTGVTVEMFQSDSERELIARVQAAGGDGTDFIILNPAGLTHASVPFRDAFAAVSIPFIEVHLSNPYAREPFRHRSLFSDLAVGVVAGFGIRSYEFALEAAVSHLAAR